MAGPWKLYLVRHAIAEERGDSWPDDSVRPLSERGISRFEKSVKGFAQLGEEIGLVLTSPLVRTRQTAEILSAGLDSRPSIVAVDSLAPNGSYAALLADLGKHNRKTSIALVGHEPNLGEYAGRLIGTRHSFEFKKGAICRIDVTTVPPELPGMLHWFLTPKILKALH